ncbi:MAG: hypothetical protein ABI614_00450 [Planctomycetota bacterium]
MRALFLLFAVSGSLVVCGCAKKVEPPPSQGLEVHPPGVDVTVDPEQGVDVQSISKAVTTTKCSRY